jgi:hypothetical protein
MGPSVLARSPVPVHLPNPIFSQEQDPAQSDDVGGETYRLLCIWARSLACERDALSPYRHSTARQVESCAATPCAR